MGNYQYGKNCSVQKWPPEVFGKKKVFFKFHRKTEKNKVSGGEHL